MGKPKARLHPRSNVRARSVSEYVEAEAKAMATKPEWQHTTQEYREWLVRQLQKRQLQKRAK